MKINIAWSILAIIAGILLVWGISTPSVYYYETGEDGNPKVYPIPNIYTLRDVIVFCLLSIVLGYAVFRAVIFEERKPLLGHLRIPEFLNLLKPDELKIYEIIKRNGSILQSELTDKTGFSPTKVSQVICLLEAYGLIEKKKKGRENILMIVKEKKT